MSLILPCAAHAKETLGTSGVPGLYLPRQGRLSPGTSCTACAKQVSGARRKHCGCPPREESRRHAVCSNRLVRRCISRVLELAEALQDGFTLHAPSQPTDLHHQKRKAGLCGQDFGKSA